MTVTDEQKQALLDRYRHTLIRKRAAAYRFPESFEDTESAIGLRESELQNALEILGLSAEAEQARQEVAGD